MFLERVNNTIHKGLNFWIYIQSSCLNMIFKCSDHPFKSSFLIKGICQSSGLCNNKKKFCGLKKKQLSIVVSECGCENISKILALGKNSTTIPTKGLFLSRHLNSSESSVSFFFPLSVYPRIASNLTEKVNEMLKCLIVLSL